VTLQPGARLGPYEIISPIGAGGMGQVWKARDTRLNRDVAIKVSAEQFTDRFKREAEAIAALNHPNICTLHDIGPDYLVMELVEGGPLTGPLPLARALAVAQQILDALAAAHRKGVTHRDLKPANILVTKQSVKLLDFGLASLENRADATMITQAGTVMGTPAYMAPEQWDGKACDARTDIYAFGCILYELLTGKVASQERHTVEPPWLNTILQRCLERDPDDRWQSARDIAIALSMGASIAQPKTRSFFPAAGWIAAGVLGVVALALAIFALRPRPAVDPPVRFTIAQPERKGLGYTAVSPDGRYIAFDGTDKDGASRLWIRALDALEPKALAGTEGAYYSFWSPDSRYLAFFTGKQLKRIRIDGGIPEIVVDAGVGSVNGGAWTPDGTLLFAENLSGLLRVPAAGGTPAPWTSLDQSRKETRHYYPSVLPDGRHVLVVVTSALADVQGVWAMSLDNPGDRRRILPDLSQAQFSQGHLLFVRRNSLMAQPFDPATLTLSGDAVPLGVPLSVNETAGYANFDVSANGVLAIGAAEPTMRLTTYDRTGRNVGAFGAAARRYQFVRLAPDGRRVAADAVEKEGYQLFVFEPDRDATTQVTFGRATGNFPVWSPDARQIAFGSNRNGAYDIFLKSSSGSSAEEVLLASKHNKFLMDWSRDGKYLLYGEDSTGDRKERLWVLPMTGDRKPFMYLDDDFDIRDARFSPDGRWVAYKSAQPTRSQVFIRSFPDPSVKLQISKDGGSRPVWGDDGRELFYISRDAQLMAVTVRTGPSVEAGVPVPLFRTDLNNTLLTYDVYRGGQRFVMPSFESNTQFVTVILNWTRLLPKP
jgi:Tol biopolymer transport system component